MAEKDQVIPTSVAGGGRARVAFNPRGGGEIEGAEMDSERAYKIFGRGLYKLMKARKWAQADFAKEAGVSDDAISRYIRGRSLPTVANAQRMAAALEMTVEEMMAACDGDHEHEHHREFIAPKPQPMSITSVGMAGFIRLHIDESVPLSIAAKILTILDELRQRDDGEDGEPQAA
jgi:transcriptional regulator with XRE-family HTH domain